MVDYYVRGGVRVDVLKVFKILGDVDIKMCISSTVLITGLSINDIVYSEERYFIISKSAAVSIPESLEFTEVVSGKYRAYIKESGGYIWIQKNN